jgi:phosphotriesterase-related protein
MISKFKERSLLKRLLLSHDDGWSVEQNNDKLNLKLFGNGNSKPYRIISEKLAQKLFTIGFTQDQMDLIFIENPKKAMAIQN